MDKLALDATAKIFCLPRQSGVLVEERICSLTDILYPLVLIPC